MVGILCIWLNQRHPGASVNWHLHFHWTAKKEKQHIIAKVQKHLGQTLTQSTCSPPLTFKNTPTTARPSGWLAASPKLEYLVFQCTKWSWKQRECVYHFLNKYMRSNLFFFTSNVYLSRKLGSVHSVLRAPVIVSSPVEMELLEPVGARDGSICQSCKNKPHLRLNIVLNWCCIETFIWQRCCKTDDSEMIKAGWQESWTFNQTDAVTVSSCCARSVQTADYNQCRGIVDINSTLLHNCLFAICQLFQMLEDNPIYCSIYTHTLCLLQTGVFSFPLCPQCWLIRNTTCPK